MNVQILMLIMSILKIAEAAFQVLSKAIIENREPTKAELEFIEKAIAGAEKRWADAAPKTETK